MSRVLWVRRVLRVLPVSLGLLVLPDQRDLSAPLGLSGLLARRVLRVLLVPRVRRDLRVTLVPRALRVRLARRVRVDLLVPLARRVLRGRRAPLAALALRVSRVLAV